MVRIPVNVTVPVSCRCLVPSSHVFPSALRKKANISLHTDNGSQLMDGTSLIFLPGFTSKALLGDSFNLFNEDSEVELIDRLARVSVSKSGSSRSCGVCDCEVGMGMKGVHGYSFTSFSSSSGMRLSMRRTWWHYHQ